MRILTVRCSTALVGLTLSLAVMRVGGSLPRSCPSPRTTYAPPTSAFATATISGTRTLVDIARATCLTRAPARSALRASNLIARSSLLPLRMRGGEGHTHMLYAHMMRVSETWLSNLKIKARTSAHQHVWGGGIAAVPAPLPTRGVALLGKEGGLTSLSSSSSNNKVGEGGAGGKWRQCAGAIIFNRRAEVLIGRRNDNEAHWQFPQGGIEYGENAGVAATREVYEEMGILTSTVPSAQHVTLVRTLDHVCRYQTPQGSWLHQQGFVGQDMHWTLFYYPGPDEMPPVDVSGLGGQGSEFACVAWSTWDKLLPRTVW
eukprot:CAMPEP_0179455338 /NCGR_PEP_ID=MMETSP0799-20121207/39320_1 /TAXON_ID=46947 /ORGANISM="Geminigera cryophila, Strain CCMP2564" /LENGTH=315 /DNA_ID=CAMNT_0021254353 /DNA_START=229 /DNA_END=1173 /DNA_ORIENTATION=-